MKLVDVKNRKLRVGQRVRIEVDIPSENGMLYKDSIVKLDEFSDATKKIRVTDSLGYEKNPSKESGSYIHFHENSPYLAEKNERLITFDNKKLGKKKNN